MSQSKADAGDRPRPMADTAVGAGLVAIGGLAALGGFAIAPDYDGSTTARIFPLLTALALAVTGGLMLRPGTRTAPRALPGSGEAGERQASLRGPFAILGVTVGYLWLIGKIGYLLSTALAAPAALWFFGVRAPLGLLASAVLCPLVYHLIFFEALGTFPPYGAWVDPLLSLGR